MKMLCLDQSTKISGYSFWDNGHLVEYGELKSDKNEKNAIERMQQMRQEICRLIDRVFPDWVVIEAVQYQSNQAVYSQLSQLQGVLFSVFFERDLGFTIIEPSAWRKSAGIKGRKRTEQKLAAIEKVKELYEIDVPEDVAESICAGIWATNNIKGE